MAARYLARHTQDLNTARPEHTTRQNLFRDHPDFLETEEARYKRETKYKFNLSDPPIPPTSPKTSGTPSVCSGPVDPT